MNRRNFLKGALPAMAAPVFVPGSALGLNGAVPPSDRVVLGHIGVGGMGRGHVQSFLQFPDARIAAICDVREEFRVRSAELVNAAYGDRGCATYNDFRELLARPDIDAIVMACPDHWHASIGLEAARQGKHMYYEKPMSMSIAENKAMRDAVRRYGVRFQFGTQQRSDSLYRYTCELVRNGRLGKLQNIFIGAATAPYSPDLPAEPVPPGFDYDLWLGPAPVTPFNTRRCTRDWTHIYDYSLGCLSGAWGIHDVDIAQWALDADSTGPIEIEATGVFPTEGLFDTAKEYHAICTYANGAKLHIMDMPTAQRERPQFRLQWMSMLFEGTDGWILVSRNGAHAEPKSLLREVIGSGEIRLPRGGSHAGHRHALIDTVRTGTPTISPIEAAVRSDTVCHLADIAMRVGRKLRWDPAKEEFIGDSTANRMMARPMRSPWRIA